MKVTANRFIPAATIAINDPDLQKAVNKGTTGAYHNRRHALFADGQAHGEAMRQQAAAAKRRALNQLPQLLQQAEAAMRAKGITVYWAEDADEANAHILSIARQHHVQSVTKSKSMVTEELNLNHTLETANIEVVETDLGEFILQINQETPSHIIAPVIHKTKESIRKLFIDKLAMPPTDDVGEMTNFARRYLREKFLQADMGITGGNFIIAETGTVCLVTNEGNARMVTNLPRIQLSVVGIEKIVATLEDYATLTQILPRSATGQTMAVYTHMLNGPRRPGELDGPEHMYVILVDNGRSQVYNSHYAEALACIRCGACLNGCPVYRVTGGHAYGWVYSGPIGAIITPLFNGLENAHPLPHASSLCGTCKQVCPVDIDIPRMLLDLRHELTTKQLDNEPWRTGIQAWARVNQSPRLFELSGKIAAWGTPSIPKDTLPGPLAGWTKYRTFPPFAKQSFRHWWRTRQKEKRA